MLGLDSAGKVSGIFAMLSNRVIEHGTSVRLADDDLVQATGKGHVKFA